MSSVTFGGANAWKTQVVQDIVRSYHWISGDGGASEPAMVLFPVRARLNAGAYVVCLSSAFKYDDMKYLIQQAAIAANVMGMDETKFTIHRIGTAIHDGLLDLIKQPPEPDWIKELSKGAVIGEMEIKKDGVTILEREVREGERGGHRG